MRAARRNQADGPIIFRTNSAMPERPVSTTSIPAGNYGVAVAQKLEGTIVGQRIGPIGQAHPPHRSDAARTGFIPYPILRIADQSIGAPVHRPGPDRLLYYFGN